MSAPPSIMWFRRDLRLADHGALTAAAGDGPVVVLFVLDDETPGRFAIGEAQRWWLHHSLAALAARLERKLLLRRGPAAKVVREVAREVGAVSVHATRLYEPWERVTEQALADIVTLHDGETLVPLVQITTKAGTPFKVYGAFWSALAEQLRKYLKELAWRDFSRSALLAQPDLALRDGRAGMAKLEWRSGVQADADFAAWTRGRTGFPIVDAGMRQLWATGWMHNRVRMIAASFLVKHLLIDWRRGAAWFWETLVDADLGNNALNWQWIAGTGTASQSFERVMAPLLQSVKFDAADYVRRWVPELAHLDDARLHEPPHERRKNYPPPLIGHREGRARALDALAKARAS